MVACDQPFEEVEQKEFCDLLTYTHHPSLMLHIPYKDVIQRCIMKMGEDTVEGTKQMFAVRLCFLAVLHGLTSV